jgi:peptide chain release factor 2
MDAEHLNQIGTQIEDLRARTAELGGIFDYDAKAERLRTVNAALEDPAVWNDPKKAQELGKEKKQLDGVVLVLDELARELADNAELYELSRDEGDDGALLAIEQTPAAAKRSRSWSSAACSTSRPTRSTASSTSRPAPAAPRPATGPACCCAST